MSQPAIAITGMAIRLAGASQVESLWSSLIECRDPFAPLPKIRFDPDIYAGELPSGRGVLGALVEDFNLDWRALRMPPAQVQHLHHVERLTLAIMGEALTDAGFRPGTGPMDKAGIWIAASSFGPDPWLDPMLRIRRHELAVPLHEALKSVVPARAEEIGDVVDRVADFAAPPLEPDVLMISACIAAGRASQIYNLRGGHLAIDAGMCSSMAAIEQAVRSLRSGECDMALVCASAPLVTPSNVLAFAHRGELALERPRPFVSNASGTLLGDGAVALILERHDDVGRKRVYATIEGIGSSVAPGTSDGEALARCVAQAATHALAQAELSPSQVTLIESRAAGVAAQDRAEAQGLARAYADEGRASPVLLSSSVPVVGFLQAASGLLALAKAALALHRRCWPAQAATEVPFEPAAGVRVPAVRDSWTGPRRAAVSDAGPEAMAYHAIIADPRDTRACARPARSVAHREPIAIVGAGVIAPGAGSLEAFWRDALACRTQLSDLPCSRWDVDRLIGSSAELARAFRTRLACTVDMPSIDTSRLRALLQKSDGFDPATILALSVAEQALQDAKYEPGSWRADRVRVVFGQIALRANEISAEKRIQYALLAAVASDAMREAGLGEQEVMSVVADSQSRFDRNHRRFSRESLEHFSGLSSALYTSAAFGFSGGALSVDGACASSLAAIKIACDALRTQDADVVLAGGVSYHLFPEYYIGLGLLDALSTRAGRPFHRDADGFVPAEAAGSVVLKRLSDAQRDGDRVYALITGHGVSSDGHGLTIYSANPAGQQLAMSRALSAAGTDPNSVDLIEAHGPGAPLGDRAEITSIAGKYGDRPYLPALSIASAKSLIGHSSSAGAMISLIRAAMALGAKVLPASAGNGELAPELPFGPTLELSRVTRPWVSLPGRPRRAAVNSFGMTGVDHHVILEEADVEPCRNDISNTALEHPAMRPARPLNAERFVLGESPVALPAREPLNRLRGKTLGLIGTEGPMTWALEGVLLARGARLVRLEGDQLTANLAPLDGIVDLSGFGATADATALTGSEIWVRLKGYSDRSFAALRGIYDRLADQHAQPGYYVAVTSVSSNLPNGGNPLGAFFQGLARSLKQELPQLVCKAIDTDPQLSVTQLAESIAQEIEDGNDRVDVRYADRRYVTILKRDSFSDLSPSLCRLEPGDVFVFSGGGRGVVYQCAAALARRGLHVVVTGRRPLPDSGQAWVTMTDAEFNEYRRAELVRRRGTEGPAQIIRALDHLDMQRQAHANIANAQSAGLSLHYETCDITDVESVARLAERVRDRFGRIDGIGHGAMIEHSATVPRKSPETIDATLSTKVIGLTNLIQATRNDRLKWFMAFGSGVGRYGNSGQTDYAAANALVAALLQAHAQTTLRNTHCVTIDWPAWESLGATANRDIAELLNKAGVTAISPEEGIYWFLSELALGAAPEVVICGERMLQNWPFLARDADGRGERALEVDDNGQPLIPSLWPMLDRVVQKTPKEHVVAREISVERDAYMPQHLLNGLPVLPATFGCELLAQGAAQACPGYHVQRLDDFHVEAPLGLPRREPVTAKVRIQLPASGGRERVVTAEVRSSLAAKAKLNGDRLHHSARITLSPTPPKALGTYEVPQTTEVVHATSFYALSRDPVRLGQLFSIARWIQVFDHQAVGIIEPPALDHVFNQHTLPRLIACPLVLDAALQVAGSWDGYTNGCISVPIGIGSVSLGRSPSPNEQTRAHARVVRVEHPNVYYDVSIVGEDSEKIAELTNVQLRRVGNPMPVC